MDKYYKTEYKMIDQTIQTYLLLKRLRRIAIDLFTFEELYNPSRIAIDLFTFEELYNIAKDLYTFEEDDSLLFYE